MTFRGWWADVESFDGGGEDAIWENVFKLEGRAGFCGCMEQQSTRRSQDQSNESCWVPICSALSLGLQYIIWGQQRASLWRSVLWKLPDPMPFYMKPSNKKEWEFQRTKAWSFLMFSYIWPASIISCIIQTREGKHWRITVHGLLLDSGKWWYAMVWLYFLTKILKIKMYIIKMFYTLCII